MKRDYYILWYYLDDEDSYLIWFSTENDDGVFVDENGFVPSFQNINDLQTFAENKQIKFKVEEPILLDLDVVKNWLRETDNKIEDYNPFLNAWNLFEDISVSINGGFDKNRKLTYGIYERLFWGCNIPVITPEGESFTPTWTKKELKVIRETLNFGFQIFREKTKKQ